MNTQMITGLLICVVSLMVAGCSSYYRVTDPGSGKTYYTTDIDGRFVLPMPSGESTLNISRSGYKPLEIKVQLKEGSTYTLDAVLVEDRRQYRSQQSGASLLEKP